MNYLLLDITIAMIYSVYKVRRNFNNWINNPIGSYNEPYYLDLRGLSFILWQRVIG